MNEATSTKRTIGCPLRRIKFRYFYASHRRFYVLNHIFPNIFNLCP